MDDWDCRPVINVTKYLTRSSLAWVNRNQKSLLNTVQCLITIVDFHTLGAAVAEWLSSWLAEQEDRGSIPRLATWIFRDWLSPASKSRYGWKIAKSTLIKTTKPTFIHLNLFPIVILETRKWTPCRSYDHSWKIDNRKNNVNWYIKMYNLKKIRSHTSEWFVKINCVKVLKLFL